MQKQHTAAAAIFITLAVVMTWPLAPRMTHVTADSGDPFINIWVLDWDHWATFHRPLSLFDANIFFPSTDTLAYSENLYGVALLLMPFRWLGASAVTAYNVAMLGGFAFSGFAAYLLGFRLTGSFIAGVAAGVFHAFVPFRFTHLPHVQHVFAGWLPLLVVALLDFVDRPSKRTAAIFGFVFLMNGLTNVHWQLFGSFAIASTALLFVISGIRRWRELIFATAIASVLLVPFITPYLRVAKTMSRSWDETKSFSASLSDWLVVSDRIHMYASLRDDVVNPERRLFPGVLSIALAAFALLLFRRDPRAVTLGLLWTIIGFAGSLGLNFYFPQFLFDAVPGFRGIRVPARWAEIAYIGLAMMIAASTAFLVQRIRWLAAAIPLLFVIELFAAPIRYYRVPVEVPPVYTWLAKQNVRAVLELPIAAGSDFLYSFRAIAHHRNLVNGASGVAPPLYVRLDEMSKSNPIPDEFVDELRRIGCELVIAHMDALPRDEHIRAWLDRAHLPLVGVFESIGPGGDWVFSLKARAANREPRTPFWTFGQFSLPRRNMDLRGSAFFAGFASSPYGIRGVDVLIEDGKVRVTAAFIADPKLPPSYKRWVIEVPKRPPGVPEKTDVTAEIIDGRGQRKRLQYFWITWQ